MMKIYPKLEVLSNNECQIFVRKNQITRAIMNILDNADKFAEKIFISSDILNNKWKIEIEDNGPGIHEKHLNRLFERFYRVYKSRARNEGGTGLGLSIVKHIVEAHGHRVQVKRAEGEGSIFFFTLTKN